MKTMVVVLLGLVMAGCSPTSGEWISSLHSREPYVFCCRDRNEAARQILSMLALNMWDVSTNTGDVILTAERLLNKDEDMRFLDAEGSIGRLQFVFSDSAVVLSATARYDRAQVDMYQGHPVMMKYRRQLEKLGMQIMPVGGCSGQPVSQGGKPQAE